MEPQRRVADLQGWRVKTVFGPCPRRSAGRRGSPTAGRPLKSNKTQTEPWRDTWKFQDSRNWKNQKLGGRLQLRAARTALVLWSLSSPLPISKGWPPNGWPYPPPQPHSQLHIVPLATEALFAAGKALPGECSIGCRAPLGEYIIYTRCCKVVRKRAYYWF